MTDEIEREIIALLNNYVARYNIDELGFRESGQITMLHAIQAIIDRSVAEARIDEQEYHLNKLQTGKWISYATEVQNRIATLTEQGDDDINVTISPEQGEKK